MKELEEYVRKIISKSIVPATIAIVGSVDRDANTCNVTVDGTDEQYNDVILIVDDKGDNQTILFPVVGSMVAIIPLFNNTQQWCVVMVSEVEDMQLHGDTFGGLVKADTLKAELDKTNAFAQAIYETLRDWIVVPNDGGAAIKAKLTTKMIGKSLGDFSSIKNDKVKHG
jgi:ribosomal protein S19